MVIVVVVERKGEGDHGVLGGGKKYLASSGG